VPVRKGITLDAIAHNSTGANLRNQKLPYKVVLEVAGRVVMVFSLSHASFRDAPFFRRGHYTPEWCADDL
jgi:hypothetical protein